MEFGYAIGMQAPANTFSGIAAAMVGLILVPVIGSAIQPLVGSIAATPLSLLAVGGSLIVLLVRQRQRRDREHRELERQWKARDDAGLEIIEGVAATILVRPGLLVIRRSGAVGFLAHGLKGDKRIPFDSVTAVEFREPTRKLNGFIQFSIHGSIESKGGILAASGDENTVFFSTAQRDRFAELRDGIEHARRRPSQTPSIADEIAKLAGLRDRGVIDPEEFARQKSFLLGR